MRLTTREIKAAAEAMRRLADAQEALDVFKAGDLADNAIRAISFAADEVAKILRRAEGGM